MSRVSKEYYELKKKAIVDATLEVCEKKTISSITMQDIINATGLSQGAIYRYYKNIDEILADLLSRIHIEQYESVDRLNEFIDMETKQIVDLHSLPITPETIERRRRLIAKQIESLYNAWAEELQNFLYPHKRIELEFLILADNFPERARAIFPNVAPSKDIDNHGKTYTFSIRKDSIKKCSFAAAEIAGQQQNRDIIALHIVRRYRSIG